MTFMEKETQIPLRLITILFNFDFKWNMNVENKINVYL